ncbi:hypothetical protein [Candidatus Methylomirabilis sp.]|uniref:hypothetical protein n=1 Tax=Candidatus Methylomirabilis sp. TaxID=2032687 RepID=UPI002A5DD5B9|nr:hypothetical protein [Candidatus Methylomirabilis sp.]
MALRAKALSIVLAGLLAGCASIPQDILQLSPESLEENQLQTRRFETEDEAKLLSASAALLQDLGFTINKSVTSLGVITASKDRSAVEAGQVVLAVLLSILARQSVPYDEKQNMRVSVVTRPLGDGKSTAVRVTFQRIVWNTHKQISKREQLSDPEIYQEFFSKLSKAVFLEAHQL